MKYLKKRNPFLDSIKEANNDILIENVNYHITKVKNLGEVNLPDPKVGDLKLSVMPYGLKKEMNEFEFKEFLNKKEDI
jgi:hypothetical protein